MEENRILEHTVSSQEIINQESTSIIESYNQLLIELSRRRNERIFVVDAKTREVVYCNKDGENREIIRSSGDMCRYDLSFQHELLSWEGNGNLNIWEREDVSGNVYRINSFAIEWRGHSAWAHIITDITDEKRAAWSLEQKAYRDPVTGVYNRLFFNEYMSRILQEERTVVLSYIDLDDLKSVNDRYGHAEGNDYINLFVETIQKQFRSTDIFARIGGDEFCIIMSDCTETFARQKHAEVLKQFRENSSKPYRIGFSYGILEIHGQMNQQSLDDIMKIVDKEMYECKRRNKQNRITE